MRIILCDDDTQFMQSFSKQLFSILQKHGVIPKVIPTHTGLDALREITHQPTDVLFLDIDMLEKIADFFRVSTDYLLGREEKPVTGVHLIDVTGLTSTQISHIMALIDDLRN